MFDAVAVTLPERLAALLDSTEPLDDAGEINLIHALEDTKRACVAAQARAADRLATLRERQRHARPANQRLRGVGSEIGLARSESPFRGGRFLGLARALVHEMPHTLHQLEHGVLDEWQATLLARETAILSREDRMRVDEQLCADPANIHGLGCRALVAKAQQLCTAIDAAAVVARHARARRERRIGVRPAPESMAYLTGLLPMTDAISVWATLRKDADTLVAHGDPRTRDQIMADLLVDRCTGRNPGTPIPVEVQIVISDASLLADSAEPAHVHDYGSVPADLVREWITDTDATTTLRRVYAEPATGALTAVESVARCFPDGLKRLITIRDQHCRTPWCDAPVRHADHIHPNDAGGPTTAHNGAGRCAQCNYAKQAPGWQEKPEPDTPGERHAFQITTPTGHTHHSTAPPLPTPLRE